MSLALVLFLFVTAVVLVFSVIAPSLRRPVRDTILCAGSALGTVPLAVLAVLAYMRVADFAWMLRGPFPFSHLGSGPFAVGFILPLIAAACVCWYVVLVALTGTYDPER